MVLEYFSLKKGDQKSKTPVQVKERETPKSPVLNDEEERFWREVTEEGPPPPLPERPQKPKNAQIALMDGADQVALPSSPPAEEDKKKNKFSAFYETTLARGNSVFNKQKDSMKEKSERKDKEKEEKKEAKSKNKKGKEKEKDTQAVPAIVEPAEDVEKENSDLNAVLDQLNLAAVNNRVFSFSKESQDLLDKFKIVLKDIVNGVPTAYDDLEKLLRGSEEQLNKLYEGLPPWIQSLVRSLPAKMTAALGPEFLAAAAEKPGLETSATGTSSKPKKRRQIPSLKSLVTAQGAVATMLRSILNFLKLRFPMFMTGTNMLLSLAVFILLFVFWYCHKRGRETRLETEQREAAERAAESESDGADSIVLSPTNFYEESLRKKAEEQRAAGALGPAGASEPPLTIHDDRVDQRPVSPRVENLPSVLDLPEPKGEVREEKVEKK